MQNKRENNYDLLRIISALAVVIIHSSSIYINAISDSSIFGKVYTDNIFVTCLYFVLTRFAVPCFVMLSGAFIISNNKNADYKYFYKKSFKNIGIPTIVFSIVYLVYGLIKYGILTVIQGRNIIEILQPIKDLLIGSPLWHMWYLYMLIGVYLLAPIVIKLKNEIGDKNFCKVSIIFLIWSSISNITSTHKLNYDIGLSFEYLSYFMIGYVIRNKSKQKSNKKAVIYIVMGLLVELLLVYIRYLQEINVITNKSFAPLLIEPFFPLVVIASILIFKGFSVMDIKHDFSKLSALSFWVYLAHGGGI